MIIGGGFRRALRQGVAPQQRVSSRGRRCSPAGCAGTPRAGCGWRARGSARRARHRWGRLRRRRTSCWASTSPGDLGRWGPDDPQRPARRYGPHPARGPTTTSSAPAAPGTTARYASSATASWASSTAASRPTPLRRARRLGTPPEPRPTCHCLTTQLMGCLTAAARAGLRRHRRAPRRRHGDHRADRLRSGSAARPRSPERSPRRPARRRRRGPRRSPGSRRSPSAASGGPSAAGRAPPRTR